MLSKSVGCAICEDMQLIGIVPHHAPRFVNGALERKDHHAVGTVVDILVPHGAGSKPMRTVVMAFFT